MKVSTTASDHARRQQIKRIIIVSRFGVVVKSIRKVKTH